MQSRPFLQFQLISRIVATAFVFGCVVGASALAGDTTNSDLQTITTLTTQEAEAVVRRGGDLPLNGLTALSDKAAEALAEHNGGCLHLNGLTALSDEAAKALAQHQGRFLYLNGLTTLTDEAAKALAQYKGMFLHLNGLTTLSDKAAKAFAQCKASLYLDGLTALTDEAAKAFAQYKGSLSLDGLTTLSEEAAKGLAQQDGWLSLDGLTTLSDKAAEALAQHNGGGLHLNGLKTLSDEAAKSLAHYRGFLQLSGLTTLSDEAAGALAQHKSAPDIRSLQTIIRLNPIKSFAFSGMGLGATTEELQDRSLPVRFVKDQSLVDIGQKVFEHAPKGADVTRVFFSFYDNSLYDITFTYDKETLGRMGGSATIANRLARRFGGVDPRSQGKNVERPLTMSLYWDFPEVDRRIEFREFDDFVSVSFVDTEGRQRFSEKQKTSANPGF